MTENGTYGFEYVSTCRPLAYGAYPDRPGIDPGIIELGKINLPAQRLTLACGRHVDDFGRIRYAGPLDFGRMDHFDLWPLNETEQARFVLWREFRGDFQWYIDDIKALGPSERAEALEWQDSVVSWAVNKVLGMSK